jgi:hypothetical protein
MSMILTTKYDVHTFVVSFRPCHKSYPTIQVFLLTVYKRSSSNYEKYTHVHTMSSSSKINEWFDEAYKHTKANGIDLAKSHLTRLLENDTAFDIDTMWEAFINWHKTLLGEVPEYSIFEYHLTKRSTWLRMKKLRCNCDEDDYYYD